MGIEELITVLQSVTCHMALHSVSGYLPPDTGERAAPRLNPSQTGRYSTYLPQTDGRLS